MNVHDIDVYYIAEAQKRLSTYIVLAPKGAAWDVS